MSSSAPRPPWFAPSSIPPILLLTFVTSFAFNHALISTRRKQQLRDHRIRTALLQETIEYNTRLLAHIIPPSSRSSRGWFSSRSKVTQEEVQKAEEDWVKDEREALVRRWRAVGLDPVQARLIPQDGSSSQSESTVVTAESHATGSEGSRRRVGPKEVTWSEIFLGSKEKRSSLTERWQKVTAGIRDSFTQLTPGQEPASSRTDQGKTSQEEDKELEELSKLWSQYTKQ